MQNSSADGVRKLNELYEDGLFRLVMNNVAEKEGKLLFEENEQLKNNPENLPSRENIKRFTKLLELNLKKAKIPHKNYRTSKIFSKTAVAIMAIIIIFSAMMVTVQAFRIQVLNFLISIEPKYTSLQVNDSDDEQSNEKLLVNWTNAYVPTYTPDGYEVSSVSYSDSIKMIKFVNQDDDSTVIYSEYKAPGGVAVDTENASFIERITINGQDGTLSVKDSTTSVAWKIDDHLVTIQGQISTDEAIKMAEGVKFVK